MWNSILSWSGIIGLVIVPFFFGAVLEQKVEPATRAPGSRLPHRY